MNASTLPRLNIRALQETIKGGEAINEDRIAQGFDPLALVVVKLVGLGDGEAASQKLSSTALREQEAAAQQSLT